MTHPATHLATYPPRLATGRPRRGHYPLACMTVQQPQPTVGGLQLASAVQLKLYNLALLDCFPLHSSMDKYILQYKPKHLAIWTSTSCCLTLLGWPQLHSSMDKYILKTKLIQLAIWKNTFSSLDKYILQFGQIHLAIWTNTFRNFDKYIF